MPAQENPVRPNMQQIADKAGVSKSAVSLALKNDPRLPEATRTRIQHIADELGYRRNPVMASLMAQLRASKTPKFQANLAWLNCSPDREKMQWHTFRDFRKGAGERAYELGYGVEDFWIDEPNMTPGRLAQILDTRSIRGLVAAASMQPGTLHDGYDDFWNRFSCSVVGIDNIKPRMPCATVDHFQTSKTATIEALKLGYKRPGMVLEPELDALLDDKFSGGYVAARLILPIRQQLPIHPFHWSKEEPFKRWFAKHKPDVIITPHVDIRRWLEQDGVSVPGDVGLIHLDLPPGENAWAGMKQNNVLVGANAADLVINQITRSEKGPWDNPKLVLIRSKWVTGPSVEPQT